MDSMNFSKAYDLVTDKLEIWLSSAIKMLPNFLIAVLVVVAFWLIARVVRNIAKRLLTKFSSNQSLVGLASTIIYIGIISIGAFVALSVLHLDKAVTSLLAGVGVIGLALGFAFQDIAANFVAGVLIATRKPFSIGDLIESNGYQGNVTHMNLRSSSLRTFDGQDVIIPNKEIFTNPLTNFQTYQKRRIDIEVGVSYGDNLEEAKSIAIEAVESLSLVDKNMDVSLYYKEFGGSSINFDIRFWVDEHEQAKYLEARSAAIIAIKTAFDSNKISIPFPIRTLEFSSKPTFQIEEETIKNN